MKLAIIGYGKLGKAIGEAWLRSGGEIVAKITSKDEWDVSELGADVVVECTAPASAVANIERCVKAGVPVVTGTTGWLEELPRIERLAAEHDACVFYATNFSIGVHLTNKIAAQMTNILKSFEQYTPSITESHHIHKLDKPSGTAITLANVIKEAGAPENLDVESIREGEIIGTHELIWDSEIDTISLKHDAKNRLGFAEGAVKSLMWLHKKNQDGDSGVFTMNELINDLS